MTEIRTKGPCQLIKPVNGPDAEVPANSPMTLTSLWVLRILVEHQDITYFVGDLRQSWFGREQRAVLEMLGLEQYAPQAEITDLDVSGLVRELHILYQRAQEQAHRGVLVGSEPLRANLSKLAELVGLDETSETLLAFVLALQQEPALERATEYAQYSRNSMASFIAAVIGRDRHAVRRALSLDSPLVGSGLLSVDWDCSKTKRLSDQLRLFSDRLLEQIWHEPMSSDELLGEFAVKAPEAELGLSDFTHLGEMVDLLKRYLAKALGGKPGANLLIYGPPGTGKTQLACALAEALEAKLLTTPYDDLYQPSGSVQIFRGSFNNHNRLTLFCVAQTLLRQSRDTLLLFDEVEDIFCETQHTASANEQKGRIHHLLEHNPVPAIWISNQAEVMDPAIVRRFDVVLEVPVPPKRQRSRIIRHLSQGMLEKTTVQRLAELETMSPAVIARALSVAAMSHSGDKLDQPVVNLVRQTLKAQRQPCHLPGLDLARSDAIYHTDYLNTDPGLEAYLSGLKAGESARLCFYGPPGTGKTALGRWLAEWLDRPLHLKRFSDLASCFVGETEKQLARTFASAQTEGAVLLLDEADSLLVDRGAARYGWEVTAVNEMLAQLETFEGIVIVSTNRMECLDMAALRRFDAKIEFHYLDLEQTLALWRKYCKQLTLDYTGTDIDPLRRLNCLTPGDFAIVAQQNRLRPLISGRDFIDRLVSECRLKAERVDRPIGF